MELVPIFSFGTDDEAKLYKVIETNKIKRVMIINNNYESTDYAMLNDFVRNIKNRFVGLSLDIDLCICGSSKDGHCRIYTDGIYDKEETVQEFENRLKEYVSIGFDGVILSDMNIDTLAMVNERLKDMKIRLFTEYKIKSNVYDAYRLKVGMPIINKEYHVNQEDFQHINEIYKYTRNIILKPALATIPILFKIKSELSHYRYSAFLTTGESKMFEYIKNEYKIDYLKEILEQYAILGYESVFLPIDLFSY